MKSAWKTARYAIEYAAFRSVGSIFAALPVETASAVSGWLWRQFAPLNKRHARALANLRMALPEKTEAERRAIVDGMWDNLGRVFAEAFHLWEIAGSDRIVIEPLDQMLALRDAGTATVVCAPHLANWELVVIGVLRPGLRPASVYQVVKNPFVDAYVRRLRNPHFPGGLFPKGPAAPKRLMKYVRDGGTIAVLADLREIKGAKVPFFGIPAPTNVFPALVARTYGAPLFAASLVREPGVRFRFRIEQVPYDTTGDRDADVVAATAALQAAFERAIRAAPEQWMWGHRRWA